MLIAFYKTEELYRLDFAEEVDKFALLAWVQSLVPDYDSQALEMWLENKNDDDKERFVRIGDELEYLLGDDFHFEWVPNGGIVISG